MEDVCRKMRLDAYEMIHSTGMSSFSDKRICEGVHPNNPVVNQIGLFLYLEHGECKELTMDLDLCGSLLSLEIK